jgi:Icc-related predicted phosphoesterase
MRYLALTDIHSNLEALDAVLRASAAQRYDAVLVLGDLVGYGADPNAVVDCVRNLGAEGDGAGQP